MVTNLKKNISKRKTCARNYGVNLKMNKAVLQTQQWPKVHLVIKTEIMYEYIIKKK